MTIGFSRKQLKSKAINCQGKPIARASQGKLMQANFQGSAMLKSLNNEYSIGNFSFLHPRPPRRYEKDNSMRS